MFFCELSKRHFQLVPEPLRYLCLFKDPNQSQLLNDGIHIDNQPILMIEFSMLNQNDHSHNHSDSFIVYF